PVETGRVGQIFKAENGNLTSDGGGRLRTSACQNQGEPEKGSPHNTRGSLAISSLNATDSRSFANSGASISFCFSLKPSSSAIRMYWIARSSFPARAYVLAR